MLTGLPKDPILLLSVVNTKLRDYYPSLDALCDDMDVSREVLEEKLGMIDYRYDAEKISLNSRKKTGIYEFISYDEIWEQFIYFNSLE